jgi:hypothetical protein
VCQRCNFLYNLDVLQWQYDWQQGPRLKNLRLKVCPTCLDVPQESGRTIVLPPDPVPVQLALPEAYVQADNPLSYLGFNPAGMLSIVPQTGSIGNLTLNAGVDAAFDSATNKRAEFSAALSVSNSSFNNYVGKNWGAFPSGITATTPSTVAALTHILSSFAIYAPSDARFLNSGATGYTLDGSSDGSTWTTLVSGTTAGTVGEILTGTSTVATSYQYHRVNLQGDGLSTVAVAQAVFNVSDQAPNDI